MSDPVIERLEAELRESQFAVWDVEKLFADRHRAKIEALEAPGRNAWLRAWRASKELVEALLALFGFVMLNALVGVWLLTGEFPIVAVQ